MGLLQLRLASVAETFDATLTTRHMQQKNSEKDGATKGPFIAWRIVAVGLEWFLCPTTPRVLCLCQRCVGNATVSNILPTVVTVTTGWTF